MYNILNMLQDNNFSPFGKCGEFCSDCKFVLNSIYSIGTTLSINECKSLIDEEPKDRNSLLKERVETPKENIINENDEELNKSQSKLPLQTSHIKHKDCDKSEEEIQILFHKKLQEVDRVHEEPVKFNEIHMLHDYEKYLSYVKPAIVEDKILRSTDKLKINKWKKQKLQISKYNHFKYSKSDKTIKNVDKIHKSTINDNGNSKNIDSINRQSEQFTDIDYTVLPKCSQSKNILNEAHATEATDYFSQCNTLKCTILDRRKRVLNIANNLLTLSTYLNDIRKNILETEDLNPSSICPNVTVNSSKKIDKSTSPILFSKTCSVVTDLAPSQENNHDMYKYNPYSTRNILKKKI